MNPKPDGYVVVQQTPGTTGELQNLHVHFHGSLSAARDFLMRHLEKQPSDVSKYHIMKFILLDTSIDVSVNVVIRER